MSTMYAVVLRDCNDAGAATVAGLIGKAFSLKDATSTNIVQSKPIILVEGLSIDEVAVISLALRALEIAGATMSYIPQDSEDLPKIDWPKKPNIFKQALTTLVRAYDMPLTHSCFNGNSISLLELLKQQILGTGGDAYEPQASPAPQQAPQIPASTRLSSIQEFTGANLPEVTPFSNVALSSAPVSANPGGNLMGEDSDIGNRMDQLFGDDDDEDIAPSSRNITSVLDRILPDEHSGTGTITKKSAPMPVAGEVSGSNQILSSGTGHFSLFLSKIPDENRRKTAIPLLIELAKISEEDAGKLAKKVIIPVLKGVSQEEAESAKHRFAEIGVLARIKS